MKTIGVLGGIGPQATMDFEQRLHRLAQQRIPARLNTGYPPLLVAYHRAPPVLVDADGMPLLPMRPDPNFLATARHLGALCDFLVVTANGPHLMLDAIAEAAGRPILSMIDVTLADVRRRGWQRVGVLGLGHPRVYTDPLDRLGIAHETIDGDRLRRLDQAIFRVMEGREDDADRAAAWDAVNDLRARRVDGVILGCTELPFLLATFDDEGLVNPSALLAAAAIDKALDA